MFLSPSSSVYLTIPVRFSISDDILKEPMEGKGSGPSCSGLNLVAHPRAKSKVWKYFGFDTDADGCILHWKRIYCRICMNHSGNTSNLSYHLEKNHPIEFSEFVKSNTDQMREVFSTVFPRTKTEPLVPHVQHLNQETNLRQSLDYENRRHSDLTAAVVTFFCEGLYPVSLVEGPAFKTLMSTVDPGYSPPCKSDLLVKMLPQMYSHTRGTVLSEVASVVYCGVTTDLWQSQTQNRTYISLYLHAVNCGFSMINRCLKTFEVQEDNTAENITQAMYETFVVTDRGGSWLATLAMLQRLKEQQAAVTATLTEVSSSQHFSCDGPDWVLLEGLIGVLQPFKVVANMIMSCRYPTISMVRPVLHMLLNTTLKVKEGDSKEISATKEVISKVLSGAYSQSSH